MKYSYEINLRSVELGGGWRLGLFEDGEEMGGGVFPVVLDDPQAGMTWWNDCTESARAHWLAVAKSSVAADAYHAHLLAEAYADAEATAYEWLDSRGSV